jgi:hypothetical protein
MHSATAELEDLATDYFKKMFTADTMLDHTIDIRDKPRQTLYGGCEGRQEGSSAIPDLDEFIFKKEDYPVVDYVLVIHATKSTTAR